MARPFKPTRTTGHPLQPRQVDRAELDRLARSVEAHDRPVGVRHLGVRRLGGSTAIMNQTPWAGWVQITTTGSNPYGFYELYDNGAGAQAQQTEGRSGDSTVNPLYEVHGLTTVPIGEVVWAWTSYDQQSFLFWYPGGVPSTFIDDVTFLGDLILNKWDAQGMLFLDGSKKVSTDPTFKWDITTKEAKGTWKFPATTDKDVQPDGVFIFPKIPDGTEPGWAPVKGEVVCNGPMFFQGITGGTWGGYPSLPTPLPGGSDPLKIPTYNPTTKQWDLETGITVTGTPNLRVGINTGGAPALAAGLEARPNVDTDYGLVVTGKSPTQSADLLHVTKSPGSDVLLRQGADGIVKLGQTSPQGGELWLLAAAADDTTGVTTQYAQVNYVGTPTGYEDVGGPTWQAGYTSSGSPHAGSIDLSFPADTAGPTHHGPSLTLSGYSPRFAIFVTGDTLYVGQNGTDASGNTVKGGLIVALGTGATLTVGTSVIASGTDKQILYDNAGTLGEATDVRIRANKAELKLATGKWAAFGVASY